MRRTDNTTRVLLVVFRVAKYIASASSDQLQHNAIYLVTACFPPYKINMTSTAPADAKILSVVSKKWDADNKGFLTQEEQALRNLDTEGTGTLTSKQLSAFAEQCGALTVAPAASPPTSSPLKRTRGASAPSWIGSASCGRPRARRWKTERPERERVA